DSSPIVISQKQTEYRIVPDPRRPYHFNIYSVDRVASWGQGRSDGEFTPFESFEHDMTSNNPKPYYRLRLKPSVKDDGTETYISIVQPAKGQMLPDNHIISMELTCTNRLLAQELRLGDINKPATSTPSSVQFKNILPVTPPYNPPLEGDILWRLLSNMALNYLSLTSIPALRAVLTTYDFRALHDKQRARQLSRHLQGMRHITSQETDRIYRGLPLRGARTTLTLDERYFGCEGEMYLFGSILNEFLALCATEKHTISRLIGSPPGYVGYGEGGRLTEAVRRQPYSAVLFDEVEKAHPDVLNLFYQMFDKGVLADGEGREINFRNTMIFMTSNLGSDIISALCEEGAAPEHEIVVRVSAGAKPALLESLEEEQAALGRELAALERDSTKGALATTGNHAQETALRHASLQVRHAELGSTIATLSIRWEQEKTFVAEILALREQEHQHEAEQKQAPEQAQEQPKEPEQTNTADVSTVTKSETPEVPVQAAPTATSIRSQLEAHVRTLQSIQTGAPLVFYEVSPELIEAIVAEFTGIPVGKLGNDEASVLQNLGSNLKTRICGQDHAIAAIERAVLASKTGLNNPTAPAGIFLLVGPSGVGKTETALAVADELFGGERMLISINMSEFQEKHTISRLIGSPPGYVGYGEGGRLTEAVRRQPYSAVLFDEVEKAHPDVLNLFYQMFDKGVLADGEGREINFRNTMIFMTSNLGSDIISALCEEGAAPEHEIVYEAIRPALTQFFKPALLGRMTIVPYLPIHSEVLEKLVVMKLEKVGQRLAQRHRITLAWSPEVVRSIAASCTAVDTGARNIDHIITMHLLPGIATTLLAEMGAERAPGTTLTLGLHPETSSFTFTLTPLVQGGAACPCTGQSVAYENPEDPLCHAIRQNKPYTTTFSPALAMPSLVPVAAAVAKENNTGTQAPRCIAYPVQFAGQHFFGGVVLGFSGQCILGNGATTLLLHATLLLALLETRKAQGNLEQTVHEQAASLEKHQPPPLEGASLGIIGNSQPLREAVRLTHTAAGSSVTVLITGETGTGKELFACAIHMLSSRKGQPFVTLNCAAIPDALLESELFGHEKGAFSGATASHQGLLRSAAGGTILLDEIGDMPLPLQAKLLRFLQDKRVRPVGSDVEHNVDLRIIAATNANLEAAVASGTFRKDLYHRLTVFPI
ncbi:hypothetical protein B566_EDAN018866, partial [Ephemera danica]